MKMMLLEIGGTLIGFGIGMMVFPQIADYIQFLCNKYEILSDIRLIIIIFGLMLVMLGFLYA